LDLVHLKQNFTKAIGMHKNVCERKLYWKM